MKLNYLVKFLFTIIIVLISKSTFCQKVKFNQYISEKNDLQKIDTLLDHGNYKKCLRKIQKKDLHHLPLELVRYYYLDKALCLFFTKQYDEARESFIVSFDSGIPKTFIESYKNEFINVSYKTSTYYDQLKRDFDSIFQIKNTIENKILKNKIIEICNNDQSIRRELMNYKGDDEAFKKEILKRMHYIDSIDNKIYDSITSIHGWISKKMLLGEKRDQHIVLLHANNKKRYEYIYRGYNLAMQNRIDWLDVVTLQSYSIFREALLNKDSINYIETFNIKDYHQDINKFNFVCFSLARQLSDGGTFNGEKKRVIIYINYSTSNVKRRKQQNHIEKNLVKNGVTKDQIVFDNSAILSHIKNGIIGIKFF